MSADENADQAMSEVEADDIDWDALERDPDYRKLRGMQRRYVVPAAAIALGFYFVFLVVAVSWPGALTARLFGGFNVAYALMLVVFLLVWAAVVGYVLLANRGWDDQVELVRRKAGVVRETNGKRDDAPVPEEDDDHHSGTRDS